MRSRVCSAVPGAVPRGRARSGSTRCGRSSMDYVTFVRTGNKWRMICTIYRRGPEVCQQMQRLLWAGCFETLVEDLRSQPREFAGHSKPIAIVLDSDTIQSTLELACARKRWAKHHKGSKAHVDVDTPVICGRCRDRRRPSCARSEDSRV